LVLIPLAARKLKIPVVASGGIADGRGLAAALTLGAEEINMGTRFCVTQEAPVHENIKRVMMAMSECDTNLIFRTLHNTGRVQKNRISDEVVSIENRPGGCEFKDIHHLVTGARGREALEGGDPNHGLIWGSQAVGLIDNLPTCMQLIDDMVAECHERLVNASNRFSAA
jgi:NADH:quinone reductase (non-electrogenic)